VIEGAAELYIVNDLHRFGIGCIKFLVSGLSCIIEFQEDPEVINDSLNGSKIGYPVFVGFDFLQD
jgi:hypothetical protein